MAEKVDYSDFIAGLFGSPTLRAVLAVLAVGGAIIRYIKESGKRDARSKELVESYGFNDRIFAAVNRWPHKLHMIASYGILCIATVQVAVLADSYLLKGAIQKQLPEWGGRMIEWLNTAFVAAFLIALVLYVLLELRGLEKLVGSITGLKPGWRNSFGWANAQWQLKSDESRRVLAPSNEIIDRFAGHLIDTLVNEPANKNLALRPEGLPDADAANILYFGHVIEAYCGRVLNRSYNWTEFYDGLARVSLAEDAPFSPAAISVYPEDGNFLEVIIRANGEFPNTATKIPNDAGLENAVREALKTLRLQAKSNAVNFAAKRWGSDYDRVLRAANSFLKDEGMRRQFAKLFILWNVKPMASRPDVFKIPFNSNIFIKYLDDGLLRYEGDSFRRDDELVQICFEAIQKNLVCKVEELLGNSTDQNRTDWRNNERARINARGIDWKWWIYYRADQQTYHLGREHQSESWEIYAQSQIRRK